MTTVANFATLTTATLLALGTAGALNWLCLRLAFVLMQPAAARRREPARISAPRVPGLDGYR